MLHLMQTPVHRIWPYVQVWTMTLQNKPQSGKAAALLEKPKLGMPKAYSEGLPGKGVPSAHGEHALSATHNRLLVCVVPSPIATN